MERNKIAIIIGAGPAGLTAAYELLKRTPDIKPIIYEADICVGGISRTVDFQGNKMDIGPHRFFSKSDVVLKWWFSFLSLQTRPARDYLELNRTVNLSQSDSVVDPEQQEDVFLVRDRLTRIFFLKHFFPYPLTLSWQSLRQLGARRILRIFVSYLQTKLFPLPEINLENFYINHFGKELYRVFFEDYTEKLWGKPCREIPAEWGRQRVKGVSITKVLINAWQKIWGGNSSEKNQETSLIDSFFYPKLGSGQLWNKVAEKIKNLGGEINCGYKVVGVNVVNNRVVSIVVESGETGSRKEVFGDYFLSSMPVKDLVTVLSADNLPREVKAVAGELPYRDLIVAGVLLKQLELENTTAARTINNIIPDAWIYIQDREVRMNRLTVCNNWSPYIIKDKNTVCIGVEYTCNEGDALWQMSDEEFSVFVQKELEQIGIIKKENVLGTTRVRVPKAYPAYFGSYVDFGSVRKFLDEIGNLFLIGRNGMHKYNNQDHSMLTAMAAVDNIIRGIWSKDNIWDINTEEEYHESKK